MAIPQTKTLIPREDEIGGEDEENFRSRRRSRNIFVSAYQAVARCWLAFATPFNEAGYATKKWFARQPLVRWFDSKFPGWQAGVLVGIIVAVLVLTFNALFLIIAMRHHWGLDGLGTLVEGDCNVLSRWNKAAHALINIMSTCLLMQSNYCMQLLASPSRHDVDVAHRKREWVDIGIQSFRNVWKRHISPWRCTCWIVLAMSSVPLHLLWNSVIIFSPSAFQYQQLAVTSGFVDGLPFPSYNGYVWMANSDVQAGMHPDNLFIVQRNLKDYERLDNRQCKQLYAQSFVRDRSDVIVVTTPKSPETNSSIVLGGSLGGSGAWPYKWLCGSDDSENFKCFDQIRTSSEDWIFPGYEGPKVEYCLSKKMVTQCKLQYGFWIALFTVIANTCKVVCFIVTFKTMKSHTQGRNEGIGPHSKRGERLLITTGDAVASFLEHPDNETIGMSITERQDFKNGIWDLRWVPIGAIIWRERFECSWFRAVGLRRWLLDLFLLASLAAAPSLFLLAKLSWFMNDIGITQTVIKQLGIGNPSGLFLFGTPSINDQFLGWRLLGKIALANSPQLAVSVAYYLWNNNLTAMIAAQEYDSYAAPVLQRDGSTKPAHKHGLRVTDPRDGSEQKSTRFLTVPVRYGITNVILWTLLHYLASQAIFFARVDVLDHWLEVTSWSISQVGYSVLGLIYFLVCAWVVFMYAVWTSLRRLRNRMPIAATCSGALSAACHPKDPWMMHHEKRVQWGVEMVEDDDHASLKSEGGFGKPQRCTFTSGEAHYPENDRFYA